MSGVMLVSGFQSTVVEDLSDWSKNLDSKVFEIQGWCLRQILGSEQKRHNRLSNP